MAEPSWSVLNPADLYYRARQDKVSADYRFWRQCMPFADLESGEDWTTLTTLLTRSTGFFKGLISRMIAALEVLDRLPRLKALEEETFLLDMDVLTWIERAVGCAPTAIQDQEYFWRALDDDLMERFTPSRPNQLLPGKKAIQDTVAGCIRSMEEQSVPGEDPWREGDPDTTESEGPEPCDNPAELMSTLPPAEDGTFADLDISDLSNGAVRIELIVDQASGAQIGEAIVQTAADLECTQGQALLALILERITTSITMNLYSASDVDDAPVFHQHRGVLNEHASRLFHSLIISTIDMDQAAGASTDCYTPTKPIRAYLQGRDWVCRWPGCNRKAVNCDADHRINHADGGPTTPANMALLCRHHHNRKTDRQAFYIIDPATGDVFWLFEDGSWAVDEAIGPLAPKQRRWVQTYAQRRSRRRERRAAEAAAERFEEYQQRINTPRPPPRAPSGVIPWMRSAPPDGEDPPPF